MPSKRVLQAAIRATRAGEAGPLWQIAGGNGPGSSEARAEILAVAIDAGIATAALEAVENAGGRAELLHPADGWLGDRDQ